LNRELILRIVVVSLLALAIVVGVPRLLPHGQAPVQSKETAKAPAPEKAAEKSAAPAEKSSGKPDEKAVPTIKAPAIHVVGGAEEAAEKPILLGSDLYEGDYDLAAEVTPRGAAVRRLSLSRRCFFRTVADRAEPADERAAMELHSPSEPPAFTLPELRIHLKGVESWSTADLSEVIWRPVAAETNRSQAVFEVSIQDAEAKPLLTVRKKLWLTPLPTDPAARAKAPPQYEMHLKIEFTGAAESVEKVAYIVNGPSALPIEGGRGGKPTAVCGSWNYNKVDVKTVEGKDIKRIDAVPEKDGNFAGGSVAWVGEMDKYFAVIMIPQEPSVNGTFAAGAETVWYRVPGASGSQTDQAVPGVQVLSKELPVTGGAAAASEFAIYVGPKNDGLLSQLYGNLGLTQLITWAFPCCFVPLPGLAYLSKFLVLVLELFYALVGNYGWAIILLVVVLRVALHPVTKWSTRSMTEMQKMGPLMQEIREKYADDKQKMQEEMQKIGGFKMLGGCLPMLIQMPIWLALYSALGAAIQLRHASFLPAGWLPPGSLFLQDLSAPDMLFHWQTPFFLPGTDIPILGWILGAIQGMLTGGVGGITSFNILPILMGISMYLQQKLTPQPPSTNPQAGQQKMMMNFMSVFLALVLYSAPAGLNLYMATSTFLGVIEQRHIKKQLAEAEKIKAAALAAGELEPEPAKQVSRLSGRKKSLGERLQAWVQKKIEEGKKAQERDPRGKGRRGK
jgi:YidC/Oxa1 family membrane protein insertase